MGKLQTFHSSKACIRQLFLPERSSILPFAKKISSLCIQGEANISLHRHFYQNNLFATAGSILKYKKTYYDLKSCKEEKIIFIIHERLNSLKSFYYSTAFFIDTIYY